MGRIATIVHDWLIGHPITWGLILFILSGLISLYSKQIKEFLHTWPFRTLSKFDKNVNINRLQLLERLHNNTFNLVLYLALTVVGIFQAAVMWSVVLGIISLIFSHVIKWTPASLQGTLLGICVGKTYQVGDVLKQLVNYDASTAYMRKVIALREANEAKALNSAAAAE